MTVSHEDLANGHLVSHRRCTDKSTPTISDPEEMRVFSIAFKMDLRVGGGIICILFVVDGP